MLKYLEVEKKKALLHNNYVVDLLPAPIPSIFCLFVCFCPPLFSIYQRLLQESTVSD